MAENFFKYSKSFMAIKRKNEKHGLFEVMNQMFALLPENYEPVGGSGGLTKCFIENGMSRATADKYWQIINKAIYFLGCGEFEKKGIAKKIEEKKDFYNNFVNAGVKALIADKIFSWEVIEELSAQKSGKTQPGLEQTCQEHEKNIETISSCDTNQLFEAHQSSINLGLAGIIKLTNGMFEDIRKLKQDCQTKIQELLKKEEEVGEQSKKIASLTECNFRLVKELDNAKKHLLVLKEKFSDEKRERQDLEASIENLKNEFFGKILDKMNLNGEGAAIRKAFEGAKKKPKKFALPKKYLDKGNIKYSDDFIKNFELLAAGNKNTAKRIASVLKTLSECGIGGVSNIKTMNAKSVSIPANSLHIKIKKHRLAVSIAGNDLIVHDVYPRKEQPFLKQANNKH